MECVIFYSERQVSVARCHPSESFHSMFIQVVLSLKLLLCLFWCKQNTLAWSYEPNRVGAYHYLYIAGDDSISLYFA